MFSLVLSAALATTAFSAVSSADPADVKLDVVSEEEGELEIWYNEAVEVNLPYIEAIIAQFNQMYPNVKVTTSFLTRDELGKQYSMGAVSGELPDLGVVDGQDTASYVKMGILADITDEFNSWEGHETYYEGTINSCKMDDRIYAIPQNCNCLALWYDKDMLDAAGLDVPQTWEELEHAAEVLTTDSVKGFAFCATCDEQGTFQALPYVLSAGGNVDRLDSEETIKAVEFLTNLYQKGYVSPDVINWGQSEVASQFAAGNCAMCEAGPWSIGVVKENAPDKNWGVALLPKDKEFASVLGGENMAMMKDCDRELGWAFLSLYCNGENTAWYCANVNRFSPRSDGTDYSDVWTSDERLAVYNEALQFAQPRGPHPRWPEVSQIFIKGIQAALTGTATPEEAMKSAAEQYADIMGE